MRFRSFFGASDFDGGSFFEVSTVDKLLMSVFSTLTVTAEEGVGLRGATFASGFLLVAARYTESLFFGSVRPDPPPTAARTGTLMVFRCSTTIGSSIPRSCCKGSITNDKEPLGKYNQEARMFVGGV